MTAKNKRPKYFPANIVEQAKVVAGGWEKNIQDVKLNGIMPRDIRDGLRSFRELEDRMGLINKELRDLKGKYQTAGRSLFEEIQKVRNGARAAFGLHDRRLADFGLNPNVKRGRPPKKNVVKQLGLDLSTEERDL